MEDESDGKQSYQTRIYSFPKNVERGALNHAFLAVNSQDDASNDNNKLFGIKYPKPPETAPKQPVPQSRPTNNQKSDPAATLLNLQLPEDLFGDFLRLLQTLGYGEPIPQKETSRSGTRSYTCIHCKKGNQDQERRFLVYIPLWIITGSDPANLSAIAALGFAFKPDSFLIVFHDSPTSPHIKVQQIIRNDWTSRYQGCDIISIEQIQQIMVFSNDDEKRLSIDGILGL